MAHDQLDNLSRVRDLGVGNGLAPKQFKPARVAKMLNHLLSNPETISRAQEISKRFDTKLWMQQTCEQVEQLLPSAKTKPSP